MFAQQKGHWTSRRGGRFIAAFTLLGLVGAGMWFIIDRHTAAVPACAAVTQQMMERAVGTNVAPPVSGVPDGGVPGASMCSYDAGGRLLATVFAFRHGADSYFDTVKRHDTERRTPLIDISADGYQAFLEPSLPSLGGPTQSFFLVKNGQYVNVLLNQPPSGAARELAAATGQHLP